MSTYLYVPKQFSLDSVESSVGARPTLVASTPDGGARLVFASALSTFEKDNLDVFMADNKYDVSTQAVVFHASSTLLTNNVDIVTDTDWQVIGGIVTNPAFFVPDIVRAFGRVVGAGKVVGNGAELRITANDLDGNIVDLTPTPYPLVDSADAYTFRRFSTQVALGVGDRLYQIEGRLNGATSASIKCVSMSLLELL